MPHIDDFLKITNFKLEVNEDNTEATVYTDGLQFSDYDLKTMFPTVHAMVNFTSVTSVVAHQTELDSSGRSLRDVKKLNLGKIPFVVSSRLRFYKPLYDLQIPKKDIKVKVEGGFIGNKTAGQRATMYTKTNEVLCTNDTLIILIDINTGRSVPMPEWWKKKYKTEKTQTLSVNSMRIQKVTPPRNALKYEIRVVGSDIDLNNHTGWSSYVKYSEDAIYHFALHGKFDRPEDGNVHVGMAVEEIELLYGAESFEGDYLDVLVWMSGKKQIYTQILKQSDFIFQSRFQYFEHSVAQAPGVAKSRL